MRYSSPRKSRGPLSIGATTLMAAGIAAFSLGQAFAAGEYCTSPYLQVQEGATPTLPDPTDQFRIESVHIGEPFINCSTKRLTAVLKIGTMDASGADTAVQPPPNGIWGVAFTIPPSAYSTIPANASTAPQQVFMQFDTTISPQGGFNLAWLDPISGFVCSQCLPIAGQPCPVSGTVSPNGTITMHLNLTSTVTFGSCDQVDDPAAFDMTIPAAKWTAGTLLSQIQGQTQILVGAAGTGSLQTNAQTVGDGEYTVATNVSCSATPVAALTAVPTSGSAPLAVAFNASTSTNTGGCGTINSYIFDFGDGQQVTQATPTVNHTYTTAGTYPARVRVTNSSGLTSSNIAQTNITVTSSAPPAVSAIVSRKTHGVGDFDIVLPQPPAARAVECRSGGANSDYKLVYTFLNNVVSVGSATVTAGAGSVSSSALGPNSNQYTVNLTGVTSGQATTVSLNNALDSSGASGSIPAVFSVLVGDASGNGAVNSSDISQTKSQSGQSVTSSNFRTDVAVNGLVNSSDISLVKSRSGTALP